jgi:hypothetical protein
MQAAAAVNNVKLRLVDDAYSRAMESLKPKNTPDEVHHRDLEKTKLTNFLRK